MEKKELFGMLSLLSFIVILFLPPDSRTWIYFAVIGAIFAYGWIKN